MTPYGSLFVARRSHRTPVTKRIHAQVASVFLGAVLIASSLCGEIRAQVGPRRSSPDAEARESSAVPPGEIHGVVVDAERGDPLEGAQVYLEGTMIGALTDSSGRFLLHNVPDGSHVLIAERLSYMTARISVRIPPHTNGIAARIAMRYYRIMADDYDVCMWGPAWSVQAVVRDVVTGRAPPSPVALRVKHGSVIDWDLDHVQDTDALRLGAGRGSGSFNVEVVADGYAPWNREDVWVEGECAPGVTLNVWLIPVDPSRDRTRR